MSKNVRFAEASAATVFRALVMAAKQFGIYVAELPENARTNTNLP
jgi:hypothetical protein